MSQLPGSLRNATRARVAGGAGDADPTAVDGCGDAVWGRAGRGERRGVQLSAPALSPKAPIIVSATCSSPSVDGHINVRRLQCFLHCLSYWVRAAVFYRHIGSQFRPEKVPHWTGTGDVIGHGPARDVACPPLAR